MTQDDYVGAEASGNDAVVVEVLSLHVNWVVIANRRQVHMNPRAKIKTDVIDVTAKLCASNLLPDFWMPGAATPALRR